MHSDSSELQRLSQNWITITWQLGDRERQLRRGLVYRGETLAEVLQRSLMEACMMGYLNKKIAFTEPDEFCHQWGVYVERSGEEIRLSLTQSVEALALQPGERLIFRPQVISSHPEGSSLDAAPTDTGLPQSFIEKRQPPPQKQNTLTYLLFAVVLVLAAVVAWFVWR